MDSKFWQLKRFNLFAELSDGDLRWIEHQSIMTKIPRRRSLYVPGDAASSVYLLKEGRVKISRISEQGKEVILSIIEPGEIFGELALVDDQPRDTLAEALDDLTVCTLNKSDFEGFLRDKPALALKLTKMIGLRRRVIETRIEDLVFCDIPTRLARLLLRLEREYGVKAARGTKIRVRLTHQEIANLIGSTRETTTAALNTFRKSGLLNFDRQHILILQRERLVVTALSA